jgi:hypothetical protein
MFFRLKVPDCRQLVFQIGGIEWRFSRELNVLRIPDLSSGRGNCRNLHFHFTCAIPYRNKPPPVERYRNRGGKM